MRVTRCLMVLTATFTFVHSFVLTQEQSPPQETGIGSTSPSTGSTPYFPQESVSIGRHGSYHHRHNSSTSTVIPTTPRLPTSNSTSTPQNSLRHSPRDFRNQVRMSGQCIRDDSRCSGMSHFYICDKSGKWSIYNECRANAVCQQFAYNAACVLPEEDIELLKHCISKTVCVGNDKWRRHENCKWERQVCAGGTVCARSSYGWKECIPAAILEGLPIDLSPYQGTG